jgi:chromosome segregation protein
VRLVRIKIAGFKSFVDPTVLVIPSNRVGIVGPNGCGKSNTIDAVRWVMGESSARHLRGDSSADVIFSGSASRKPVGQASVELIFDNSSGRLGGAYAAFGEISIRRLLARDGQSRYFLNGTRARRRDVTDLFLGTGLGPRSYSIIEQGMISRLIEARPEDLRVFLEEAAGISRYRERRRETENRVRHTRENLERLADIREEVDRQEAKLTRQAAQAEKYREWAGLRRRRRAEWMLLQWRLADAEWGALNTQLVGVENRLQDLQATAATIEAELDVERQRRDSLEDHLSGIQADFYQITSVVSGLEQSIRHAEVELLREEREIEQLLAQISQRAEELERTALAIARLAEELDRVEEENLTAESRSQDLDRAVEQKELEQREARLARDAGSQSALNLQRQAEVARTQMDHAEESLQRIQRQVARLQEEEDRLALSVSEEQRARSEAAVAQATESVERLENQRDDLRMDEEQSRARIDISIRELNSLNQEVREVEGRLATLEILPEQQGSEKTTRQLNAWLRELGLDEPVRVGTLVQVDPGWEKALETVLGVWFEAVMVSPRRLLDARIGLSYRVLDPDWPEPEVREESLAHRVQAPAAVRALLADVICASDLASARVLLASRSLTESVVTPDGVWMGQGWVVEGVPDPRLSGVVERLRLRRDLEIRRQGLVARRPELEASCDQSREMASRLAEDREAVESGIREARRELTRHAAELQRLDERHRQAMQRQTAILSERQELMQQRIEWRDAHAKSLAARNHVLAELETARAGQQLLEQALHTREQDWQQARKQAREAADESNRVRLRLQEKRHQAELERSRELRLREQHERDQLRVAELREHRGQRLQPLGQWREELQVRLRERHQTEGHLADARAALAACDEGMRERLGRLRAFGQDVEMVRGESERLRLRAGEIGVQRTQWEEQIAESGFAHEMLAAELPPDLDPGVWQTEIRQLDERIEKLGPINLAAIEEAAELRERSTYLRQQQEDLETALATLEEAMQKIDRETRQLFRDTHDAINAGFGHKFARLFGGGEARLELLGDDLLHAGVTIMARPPGKRLTTINLMSGGEKALTAAALVFAIFELNPAPFCMLDEVDAPLDEANVGRFCNLLEEMSANTQFVFITHNKATMAVAEQLIGVTMHEPGVSRLVSVDIAEAVELAQA